MKRDFSMLSLLAALVLTGASYAPARGQVTPWTQVSPTVIHKPGDYITIGFWACVGSNVVWPAFQCYEPPRGCNGLLVGGRYSSALLYAAAGVGAFTCHLDFWLKGADKSKPCTIGNSCVQYTITYTASGNTGGVANPVVPSTNPPPSSGGSTGGGSGGGGSSGGSGSTGGEKESDDDPAPPIMPCPIDSPNLWRGLVIAPEDRCTPYGGSLYRHGEHLEELMIGRDGGLYDPYTGVWHDSPLDTHIEHVVAKAEAHDSGLCSADHETRQAFSNDLDNLVPTPPQLNRQKADKDPAEWMPDFNQCWFAKTVVEVKRKYGLTVDVVEAGALERVLRDCESTEKVVVERADGS